MLNRNVKEQEWTDFLAKRRNRTGLMVWTQVVAALEAAYGHEEGAPAPYAPPEARPRRARKKVAG